MAHAGGAGGHPDGCACGCHEEADAQGDSLFSLVDTERITALNEEVVGSAKTVFRALEHRGDKSFTLLSNEGDPELIVHVPFTSAVKIKSVTIAGNGDDQHPTEVRLFVNRDDIDFEVGHSLKPEQVLALNVDVDGDIDYALRTSKFASVHSLTMFFTKSLGGEDSECKVHYIGFKGVNMKWKRSVVTAVYETQPTASDLRTKAPKDAPTYTGTA